ncbi:hypothetical protein ANN_18959 [Periplaneta americana]|uniref:Uncharacterized protein n=1 Tax=Periplaneta americana TaxID=6978 RepID=A0ABQ8SQP7_PERAM|nr:hypothetical protein ANN_18959 [Periplaneta americana]
MAFSKHEQSFCVLHFLLKSLVHYDSTAMISSRIPEGSICFQQYQELVSEIPDSHERAEKLADDTAE